MSQFINLQLQQEHIKLLKEFALLRNEQAVLQTNQENLLNQLSMALQANAELRIENQAWFSSG